MCRRLEPGVRAGATRWLRLLGALSSIAAGDWVLPRAVHAQASVPGMRGDWGLKSGSQMAPGEYLGFIYQIYDANKIIDKNGVSIPRVRLDQQAFGAFPAYVSPHPIVGGHWGVYAAIPVWANASIGVANADVTTGWALSDFYVQPIYLGWTFPRADLTTGFGVSIPTGRFKDGATNNTGLGMWGYNVDAGATVYADSAKHWNIATLATFQTQSNLKGTDKRPGNNLTLEGGAGYAFLKGLANAGIVYYAQWKVSDDRNFPILRIPRFNGRNRYYALGPELTVPLAVKPLPLVMTARYFIEMGNRVATQGNSFLVFLTAANPFIPKKPNPEDE